MILVNGKQSAQIHVMDRGLHYGDGLFETIAYQKNKLLLWENHWQRLSQSAEILNINLPDKNLLRQELEYVAKDQENMVLKLLITRGIGERGYKVPASANPTRIIISNGWPNYPKEHRQVGINVHICEMRLSSNKILAGIKHLNRLENIVARSEWVDDAVFEGLMLDQDNYVVEGTMSNLFIIKNNTLFTAPLTNCGIAGIMRQQVINFFEKIEQPVRYSNIELTTLLDADEILLSNSIIGVWPVKKIQNYSFARKPSALTEKIQDYIYSQVFN